MLNFKYQITKFVQKKTDTYVSMLHTQRTIIEMILRPHTKCRGLHDVMYAVALTHIAQEFT